MAIPKSIEDRETENEAKEINRGFFCTWWVARTTGIVVIALLFVVLAETSTILWLLPLKEVKPYLLTGYNKDTQVVKVEPIEKTTLGWNKLMEIFSKQFVIDLHTIDGQTENHRLKKLSLMADAETQEFIDSQLNMNSSNSTAKKLFESGITRSIHIKGEPISLAPEAPNTWQVEWEALENDINAGIQRKNTFISVITAETKEKKYHSGEEELNPIGYTVIRYSLRMASQ